MTLRGLPALRANLAGKEAEFKILSDNRQASHNYFLMERFEAGMVLMGTEVKAARAGKKPPKGVHFPTIDDGVKGLAFIEAAVKSSKANGKWTKL